MSFPFSRVLAAAGVLLAMQAGASAADAVAGYPARPVRVIVPLPPGGTNDILARVVTQQLTVRLGQTFVVENRPGGNSNIGAEVAARATPDGYTLLATWAGPLALNQNFSDALGYDAKKDFTPISLLADVPTVLVAHPSVPAKNLKEFIDYSHANPGKVAMAITTAGSLPHLLTERLRADAKLDVVLVPYQGSGPAIKDLLGNQTQAHFENLPAVITLINAGKLKALTVASTERIAALPDVPTTAEDGYPAVVATPWFALVAPKGVPAPIIARLNTELVAVLKSPEVREAFAKAGARPHPLSPTETSSFIDGERSKWAEVIRTADIKLK